MKKHLHLPIRLELVRYPTQMALLVTFESEAILEWCLGLCMLKEGVIEALIVSGKRTETKLEIRKAAKNESASISQASFESAATILMLPPPNLGYLLHFFLKYCRDGMGEVDHIDLEVDSKTEKCESTITFNVPKAVPPMSAEECKKRLGL